LKIAFDGAEFTRRMAVSALDDLALAERAHVDPGTVARARHGKSLTLKTASRLARALKETPIVPELDELVAE
jgi:plasmid maintenance system antidote protein VapI